MGDWVGYTVVTVLLYGLWGFFPKLAVGRLSPRTTLFYETFGTALVGLLVLLLPGFRWEADRRGILFAALTGVCGMVGTLFFFEALTRGRASVITVMTALYPIVTLVLALVILREPISLRQWLGMGLALAAMVLLAA